ncbi:hypothetical protein RclHR1_05950001 [Rhizophagus clarus]|uniref:Uncharacterized protein n=1 Tax=Rhizophagus clarus TaxID=94130 RepID=A0A2Z6SGY4_9GLOM|nr:hypothetical protein RclHR1_05950001 [Rhizophagus clarus]
MDAYILSIFQATYKLDDEDEGLVQCIKKIKRRLGNADSNKALHYEYILIILHAFLYVVKRIIEKELTLALSSKSLEMKNLVQCESALQVNKKNGNRKSVFASNGISSISKDPLNIRYSESILKKGRKSFEVIFGLLKDSMSSEIELLKQRIANLEAENVELKNENAKLRHIIVENAWLMGLKNYFKSFLINKYLLSTY